jgi:outer membrane protein
VTKTAWAVSTLALTIMSSTPVLAQQKVGVVQMQTAITATKEGQKAAGDLQTKMAPKQKELEAKQAELRKLQETLQKGASAMNEQARAQMARELEVKNKDYQRTLDDAKADLQSEQDRILNELGAKLMAVVNKYSKDNGYSLVIDVSNPQTPVMYASDTIDITKDVVDLYDKNSGAGGSAAAKPAMASPAPAPPAKKLTPAPAK